MSPLRRSVIAAIIVLFCLRALPALKTACPQSFPGGKPQDPMVIHLFLRVNAMCLWLELPNIYASMPHADISYMNTSYFQHNFFKPNPENLLEDIANLDLNQGSPTRGSWVHVA